MATVIVDEISPPTNPVIDSNRLAPGVDANWTLADLQEHLGGIPLNRIRLFPSPGLAKEVDLLVLKAQKTCLPELIDGVLVEKPLGHYESQLASILAYLIQQFVLPRKLGVFYGSDCPIRLMPEQIRMPDVAYISWSRFPGGSLPSGQVLALTPELTIEVISPSNSKAEMERKVKEYFLAGTRLVWYVYPEKRTVRSFRSPTEFQDLEGDQILDGGDVLPGFEVPVKTIFELAQR